MLHIYGAPRISKKSFVFSKPRKHPNTTMEFCARVFKSQNADHRCGSDGESSSVLLWGCFLFFQLGVEIFFVKIDMRLKCFGVDERIGTAVIPLADFLRKAVMAAVRG